MADRETFAAMDHEELCEWMEDRLSKPNTIPPEDAKRYRMLIAELRATNVRH